MSRHIALIPAAGVGARFGAGKPKQYVEINGQTVLQHTLAVFLAHAQIDHIAVVLSPEDDFFQTASTHRNQKGIIMHAWQQFDLQNTRYAAGFYRYRRYGY